MAAPKYIALQPSLWSCAEIVRKHFTSKGYTALVEGRLNGAPYSPTFRFVRKPEVLLIEVVEKITTREKNSIADWNNFCKLERSQPTYFVFGVCDATSLTNLDEELASSCGVGILVTDSNSIRNKVAPKDVSISAQLPKLGLMPTKVRRLLGKAYDHFDKSEFQLSYESACREFEKESRNYLKRHQRSGRIVFQSSGKPPRKYTNSAIEKLTMGQLLGVFETIQMPNYSDKRVIHGLRQIVALRNLLIHHSNKLQAQKALRENFEKLLWAIIDASKEVVR